MSEEEYKLMLAKNKVPNSYEYEFHSFNASLEPFYFWLLDFASKIGYKFEKVQEDMGASVVSQFFGDISARKQFLEKRGMEILGSVNTIVKSVINLLYDLRELDRRLAVYKDYESKDESEKRAGMSTLKRVWMDEVDIKKGPGSINSLSAQKGFDFVTLRDAFLTVQSQKEIDGLDLNDRVKRILRDRLEEFDKWLKESKKELSQRRKIELSYLKSQVESLRLYSKWARPYLKAAQMLNFKEAKLSDPQLIQAFDQDYIILKIRGNSKMYLNDFYHAGPGGAPKKSKPPKFISSEKKAAYAKAKGPYVHSIIELTFTYRARPSVVSQTAQSKGYAHFGMVDIKFDGYVLRPDEYEKLKKMEELESLKFIEGLTTESLGAMREELEQYLGELEELKKEDKKEDKKKTQPLLDKLLGASKKTKSPGISLFSTPKMLEEQAKSLAVEATMNKLFTVYDVFKKAHRLLSFPYPPEMNPGLFESK